MEEQPHIIKGTLGNLRGIIHKSTIPSKGIVILTHGYFTSTKLGPENLHVQIARIFANCGYEFWRFDSHGVGDSDGDFHESTYESRVIDYKIITELALKQHENILILGHSTGTSMAVHLANMYPQNIKTLFLLAPTFGKFTYLDNLISQELQKELQEKGFAFRRTQRITKDFIEQMMSEEIYSEISKCNAKCILFYGLKDEYYDKQSVNRAVQHMKNHALIAISGCGHNFLNNRTVLFEYIKSTINEY
jgi:pimeloyl-ACP methyl ester carboxylesterase